MAILADKSKTWRPSSFTNRHWGTTMLLHFPTRKLQDYNTPEILAELEKSINPFAHLVAATLYAQATRPNSKERERKKYHLVRKLYDLGLGKEKIRHFFKLIDWVLTLSPKLTQAFNDKIQQFEEENKMPYITSVEQLGIEKGRKDVARRMLSLDFTREQIQQATELSEQELAALEKEREAEKD